MTATRGTARTTDAARAEELFRLAYPGGGLALSEPDHDFIYQQQYAAAGPVGAVQQSIGARVESTSNESDQVTLAWASSGENLCWMGSHRLSTRDGLLWSGRRPIEGSIRHATISAITLQRDEFERRAALLLGRREFVTPEFTSLPTPSHIALARSELSVLLDHQLTDLGTSSELTTRTATDHAVAVVIAAAGLDSVAHGPIPSRTLRRALTFIDDNLNQPISVLDVAAAAGLSVSGLNHAFRRELGEGPAARIRRLRLEHARNELLAADPTTDTVAAIARRWGFNHLGRFARDYRLTYREQPNITLRH